MLLISLLIIPLLGTILVCTNLNILSFNTMTSYSNVEQSNQDSYNTEKNQILPNALVKSNNDNSIKLIGLTFSIINLFVSIIVFLLFNFSSNSYQFVQEYYSINMAGNPLDFYLGVDGISIYFVLLTTIIMPIAILSN